MPTYQYACTECGERLEVVQKFTDEQLTVCPACKGRLRKLFSPVGVVFKGSGFYKNDSRGKSAGESKPAADEKGSKPAEPAAAGTTGSSKPADSSAPAASSPKKESGSSSGDGSKVA
jgi:putative FmdB family regulatory protein